MTPTNPQIRLNDAGTILWCSSEKGNPPPNLRWEAEGLDLHSTTIQSKKNQENSLYLGTKFSLLSQYFKDGNVLKCVAEHPGMDKPLIGLFYVYSNNSRNIVHRTFR